MPVSALAVISHKTDKLLTLQLVPRGHFVGWRLPRLFVVARLGI